MSISINRSRLGSVPREPEAQPNANGRGLEGAAPRARELAPHMQALRDMRGGARMPAQDARPTIGPPVERPQLHVGTVSSPLSLGSAMPKLGPGLAMPSPMGGSARR